MVGMRHGVDKNAIAAELLEKAAELWGQARADQIRGALHQAADYLHQVAENLPARDEEPAFFL